MKLGEKIIIVGLFIQLTFFGCFILVGSIFHRRMARCPTPEAMDSKVRWRWYLITLYVAGALIWVRSLFRVIEFIDGNHGTLMRSEVYVFVFDGLLMIIVLAWMNWFHPSEIGLLLRGDEPITNGLQLLMRRSQRKRVETIDSESSNTIVLEQTRRSRRNKRRSEH